jgi:16S rRNA (uracil1498-N3)-methyltransferase
MTARHSRGPRLFLSDLRFVFSSDTPQQIALPQEQSHHVRDVLRLSIGDSIEIGSIEQGSVAKGTIAALHDRVSVTLHAYIEATSPQRQIQIVCALCKGDKNEQILDWATELGCRCVHFWQASRSIVRLKNDQEISRKVERLSKIALAAAQQSRQPIPPRVEIHQTLRAAISSLPELASSVKALCSLSSEASSIHELLASKSVSTPIIIACGPEGDFTPEEEHQLCHEHGFTPVSLGPAVLRSELAVVTAIVSIRAHDQLR